MLSLVFLLVPALSLVLGILLPLLAYRRGSDGGPAKVPAFFRAAWILPIVPPLLIGLVLVPFTPGTGPTYGNTAALTTVGFFVPVAFLLAFVATRDKKGRTTFLVSLTISAAFALISTILPGIATTYLEYLDSPLTMLATIVIGLYPCVALGYALYEREDVEYRAFKRLGLEYPELAGSHASGTALRNTWFLPMVAPAIAGIVTIVALVEDGAQIETTWTTVIVNLLVPASWFLALLATRDTDDKRFFWASAAIWAALTTVSAILVGVIRSWAYDTSPLVIATTVIMSLYPIAALVIAVVWRRKGVRERAERRLGGRPTTGARRIDAPTATVAAGEDCPASAPDASGAAVRALFEEALGTDGGETPVVETQPASTPTPAATTQPTAPATTATPSQAPTTVDVNTCSELDLLDLPGMTISVARAAVAERTEHGPYRSVEDFVGRNSLKPHLVVRFIDNLTCSQRPTRQGGSRRPRTLDL